MNLTRPIKPLLKATRKTLTKYRRRRLNRLNRNAAGGLVVGYEKRGGAEDLFYLSDDVHSLTIGATRSGKSRSIVIESIAYTALAGESICVSDPKGELAAFCGPFLERLKYEVVILDFKSPLKSSRYNFLQPVIDAVNRDEIAKAVDLVWDITSSLVPPDTKVEQIWNHGEASVIAGAIMSVVFDNRNRPEFQNLTNVFYFILNMCKTKDNDMAINKYVDKLSDSHPAKGLFGIAQIAPSRTRGSFFTSALATLRLFTNENVYNMTSASDFVLEDTGNRKRAIFIILPDQKLTFYSLASLFIYQHYIALTESADDRGGRLKIRVNMYLDEFGNFTKIPAFSNILTVGGGRGCRFNIFVQSISQITDKYGKEESQTICDNCHCWIYLKTASNETATDISKHLGQYTTSSYSRSSSYNSSGTSSGNVSNSMNLIARPLLTEDEIRRIDRPYALVMYVGYFPAIMRLPDLSEWSLNDALGMGDIEHNRKLRAIREKKRIARKPERIKLWGIWNEYKPKNKQQTESGDNGGSYQEEQDEYRSYEDQELMRMEARPVQYRPDDTGQRRSFDKRRSEISRMVQAGMQMDNMFDSFKKNPKLSQKEKERIDNL